MVVCPTPALQPHKPRRGSPRLTWSLTEALKASHDDQPRFRPGSRAAACSCRSGGGCGKYRFGAAGRLGGFMAPRKPLLHPPPPAPPRPPLPPPAASPAAFSSGPSSSGGLGCGRGGRWERTSEAPPGEPTGRTCREPGALRPGSEPQPRTCFAAGRSGNLKRVAPAPATPNQRPRRQALPLTSRAAAAAASGASPWRPGGSASPASEGPRL